MFKEYDITSWLWLRHVLTRKKGAARLPAHRNFADPSGDFNNMNRIE